MVTQLIIIIFLLTVMNLSAERKNMSSSLSVIVPDLSPDSKQLNSVRLNYFQMNCRDFHLVRYTVIGSLLFFFIARLCFQYLNF